MSEQAMNAAALMAVIKALTPLTIDARERVVESALVFLNKPEASDE